MGETRAHGAGTYGNVVLTKLPVLGSGRCDLSCGPREPRGCLRVDLDIEGAPVHVFNCHFGLALSERRAQLALLGVFIRDSERLEGPRVLLGDFNEWHRGPVTRGLRREFSSPMRRRRTHPAMFQHLQFRPRSPTSPPPKLQRHSPSRLPPPVLRQMDLGR